MEALFVAYVGPPQPEEARGYSFDQLTKVDHAFEPTHQIAFPGTQFIHAVDFSPDGRTAYCLVDGQRVDLWAAGLSRWPEAFGGLLGLVVLVYALVIFRMRRHPQSRGQPYCRKCNYHVVSQAPGFAAPGRELPPAGTLCPECGVDLSKRRPRHGRSMWRRLRMPTAVVLMLAMGYIWLFVAGYSRGGRMANMVGIWSTWVDDYTEKNQTPWLLAHRIDVAKVMTVDTQSGSITGCLRTIRGGSQAGLRVSPDGRFLVVGDGNDLRWVCSATGRLAASTTGGVLDGGSGNEVVVGFAGAAEDPLVYYGAADQAANLSRLFEWNPRTGEQRTVVEEPAFVRPMRNGALKAVAKRYALLKRADGLATASASDFIQAYDEEKYTIVVRSPISQGGAIERTIEIPDKLLCLSPIAPSADGNTLFLCGGRNGLLAYDLCTGQRSRESSSSGIEYPDPQFDFSAGTSRAFVPVHTNAILVRDVAADRWIARLNYPQPFIAPRTSSSPDGRWIATTPFKSTGGSGGPYIHELFLYDISVLNQK